MTQDFKNNQLFNSQGSAITLTIMAMAMIALFSLAAVNIHHFTVENAKRAKSAESIDALAQTVELYVSDNTLCMGGIDGPGPKPGVTLVDPASGISKLNIPLASAPPGQDIQVPTNISAGGGNTVTLGAGTILPGYDLRIDRLYILLTPPVAPLAASPADSYAASVLMTATQMSTGLSLGERKVIDMQIQVDPVTTALTGCTAKVGPQQMCQQMGCTWMQGSTDQKCQCSFRNLTLPAACPNGGFIAGYSVGNVVSPICSTINISCAATKGPGYFMVGIDQSGNPICVAVAPGAFAANGVCGAAGGGTFPNAAAATAAGLCSVGVPSIALSDPGPWGWNCSGVNGGSSVGCNANQGAAVPLCAGNLPRARCCGGVWSSQHPVPVGGQQFIFCGCGNSPEWWMSRTAAGVLTPNGC